MVSSEGQEATPTLPRLLPPVGARAFIKLLRCTARARRPGVAATPRLDRGSSVAMVALGQCSMARAHDLLMTSFWPAGSFGSARGSTCGIARDVDCASTRGRGLYAFGHNTRARRSGTPPARVVTGTWRHVFTAGVLRSETPSTSERRARARHERPWLRGECGGRDICAKIGARRETRGGRVGYAC